MKKHLVQLMENLINDNYRDSDDGESITSQDSVPWVEDPMDSDYEPSSSSDESSEGSEIIAEPVEKIISHQFVAGFLFFRVKFCNGETSIEQPPDLGYAMELIGDYIERNLDVPLDAVSVQGMKSGHCGCRMVLALIRDFPDAIWLSESRVPKGAVDAYLLQLFNRA